MQNGHHSAIGKGRRRNQNFCAEPFRLLCTSGNVIHRSKELYRVGGLRKGRPDTSLDSFVGGQFQGFFSTNTIPQVAREAA